MSLRARGTALVTGATSGIGAAFATQLAAEGYDLLVTGRREPVLRAAAERWRATHGVRVDVVVAELADRADREALATLIARSSELEILVNNAGFGLRERFANASFAAVASMVEVHALATLQLCHAALPGMLARRTGSIVNVSSLAAFIPYPGNAAYSATKALINNFTETLSIELRGTGVRVQVLCPGLTRTDFHSRLGESPDVVYARRGLSGALSPQAVVNASLAGLRRGQVVCVPGTMNRVRAALVRKLPRALVNRIVVQLFGDSGKP